jgi:hypothetical protein
MADDREALLQHYREMRAALLSAIDGVSAEELAEDTLDGWSVNDHLAHLALWDEIRAAEVERISAGFATAWPPEGHAVYDAMGRDLRKHFSGEQVRWELEQTHQRLLDAIASATDAGLDGSRYGEAGLFSDHEAQHAEWIKRWRAERRSQPT